MLFLHTQVTSRPTELVPAGAVGRANAVEGQSDGGDGSKETQPDGRPKRGPKRGVCSGTWAGARGFIFSFLIWVPG